MELKVSSSSSVRKAGFLVSNSPCGVESDLIYYEFGKLVAVSNSPCGVESILRDL